MLVSIPFLLVSIIASSCISYFAINPNPAWLNAVYIPLLVIAFFVFAFLILISVASIQGIGYKKDCVPEYHQKDRIHLSRLTDFCLALFSVKIQANGFENVPDDQAFLVVGNHRSNIDSFCLDKILRKHKLVFVAKDSLFKLPWASPLMYKCGYLKLNRDDLSSGFEMMRNAQRLIQEGVSVGIFPEGTRGKVEGDMGPFHNGALMAAIKAKAPIVVTALHKTHDVNNFLLCKIHKVKVNCLKVYRFEDYKDVDPNQLGDEIRSLILEDIKIK